jgi:hypothetical protein
MVDDEEGKKNTQHNPTTPRNNDGEKKIPRDRWIRPIDSTGFVADLERKKKLLLVVSFGSIQRYSSSCSPNSYPIDPLSRLRL